MATCCSRRWAGSTTTRGGISSSSRLRGRWRCCRRPRTRPSLTNFEDCPPFTSNPEGAALADAFRAAAEKANLPYPHADSQAGYEYAGWQILGAAVTATRSLDDEVLARWLDTATVDTVVRRRDFRGRNHMSSVDLSMLRQLQRGKWVAVWPPDQTTPGVTLIAP